MSSGVSHRMGEYARQIDASLDYWLDQGTIPPSVYQKLNYKLEAALRESYRQGRSDALELATAEMDAEFRDDDGDYPAVGPYALMFNILDNLRNDAID